VKVKVLSIYDPSYRRYSIPPPAEQVESMLQEWLNDTPNAKIAANKNLLPRLIPPTPPRPGLFWGGARPS
jgi:hypothetical protein